MADHPTNAPASPPPDRSDRSDRLDLEAQRRANRDALRELTLDPYGRPVSGPEWIKSLQPLATAQGHYDEAADQAHQESEAARKAALKSNPDADLPPATDERPRVTVAGRVVLRRPSGKLIWMNLRDPSCESFQVAVSARDCDEAGFEAAKLGDLGDLVVVSGPLMKTRTGEITCWAETLRPASKCLVPPPEKHKGLTDPEARFRRRAMDLWATPHAARTLVLRSHLLRELRRYLDTQGFLEVETPVLQTLAGGAAARPFVTHMNALGIDLFLRIAPELYLKRLMVGGLDAVYEVSRNFRNEGVDRSHNPEFTSLEVYRAYGDYETMAQLAEGLIRHLAKTAVAERAKHPAPEPEAGDAPGIDADTLTIPFGDLRINYAKPFDRVTYAELFERALGFPMTDFAKARDAAKQHKLKTTGANGGPLDNLLIVNELFEEVAEATIDPARPTFVFDYPASLSPLTRPKLGTEHDPIPLAERWDIFIGGMEIGPAYTELNDPDIQEAKFREQLTGLDDEESTFRTFDQEFIDALKTGMPPAGGLGLGIDRLVMLLSGHDTIREVIAFPLMRPRDARSVVLEILGALRDRQPEGVEMDDLLMTIRAKGLLSDVPDATLRTQIDALADRGHLVRTNDRYAAP